MNESTTKGCHKALVEGGQGSLPEIMSEPEGCIGVIWKESIPAKAKAQTQESATTNMVHLMLLGCVQDKADGVS